MKLQGSEAGEVEVGVSMAESPQSLSDTQSLNASQSDQSIAAKKPREGRRGSRTRNRSRNVVIAMLEQAQVKLVSLSAFSNLLADT